MRSTPLHFAAILALAVGCTRQPTGEVADVVYTNGSIYTVNKAQPRAEAVAIQDGKFLVVGSHADVEGVIGEGTEVVDLDGRFVMPGIVDLHSHPFITPWYGSMNLTLENAGNADAILEDVKAYAEANPDKEWIIGGQWASGLFPNDSPQKERLDAIVSDRPVALLDNTGHSMWLNSRALELAGITAETPTNQLVVIDKDPQSGHPTGTVREQAIQSVERAIPQATPEEYAPFIADVFEMFASYGVTSQQTAEGHRAPLEWCEAPRVRGTPGTARVRELGLEDDGESGIHGRGHREPDRQPGHLRVRSRLPQLREDVRRRQPLRAHRAHARALLE